MMDAKMIRVAWLFPSLALGNYWHPVLAAFAKSYPQTTVFTGNWPGFSPGFEHAFNVRVVGQMTFVDTVKSETGYNKGFINASPAIAGELLRFKPHVIFTSGFSIWTVFALLLKLLTGWRVVIIYDGSSPIVDYRNSPVRLAIRRLMTRFTNAFITNSTAGKSYLMECLKAKPSFIFAQPYQVPDVNALLSRSEQIDLATDPIKRPIFLFTGQVILRKGIDRLLEACKLLQDQGIRNYTLLVAGDGEQREELQEFCKNHDLDDCVHWLGWVSYGQLGTYFRHADVFILPTLEDVWGMVVLEAMAFGKPILCSKWAGAAELVSHGENGYLFDPYQPEDIAEAMNYFISQPDRIPDMGMRSQLLIAQHTPADAAKFLANVTDSLVGEA